MVDRKADAACGCIGFLGSYKIYEFELTELFRARDAY